MGEPGRRTAAILLALSLVGALWRVVSFRANIWPHGDVVIDGAIAESVARTGRLLVPFVDVRYYPTRPFGFGYPLDQHPPLWPLLGAPLVPLLGEGYAALKVVSLLVGVGLIPLTYLATRRHIGGAPALFASALVAGSYPLVDFSGNGSLWVLLAAGYLGWLWLLPTPGQQSVRRWAGLGVLMGLAYLTNYPAVVLPIGLGLLHLLRHGRAGLGRRYLAGPAVSALLFAITILPWLAHNTLVFGAPFWSQPFQRTLSGGSRDLEYLVAGDDVVKRNLPASGDRQAALRARALDLYGNVGFVARQLLVLTPVLGGLFLAGVLAALPWPGTKLQVRLDDPLPVVVLALLHLALILWWPTTKFRYLVPLLPLICAVGAWLLWRLEPVAPRARLALVTLGLCLFTNLWTMVAIPSHTYYYDGGIVGDNFGQQGETVFVEETRRFRAAADAIVARGPGVILADHILGYFTGMPLVVSSTGYPPDVVDRLVQTYGIRYIVVDRPHVAGYDFLRPTLLWSDDRYVVLELPRP